MTPTEINIAIAEACGWVFTEIDDPVYRNKTFWNLRNPKGQLKEYEVKEEGHRGCGDHVYWRSDFNSKHHAAQKLPNYHSDLNACAEAWLTLNALGRDLYADKLLHICNNRHFGLIWSPGRMHWEATIDATAPQRCEAFLRVKGLWRAE